MATFDLKSLGVRVVSAIVLIAVSLFAVISGGWAFYILIGVLAVLSAYEWLLIARQTQGPLFHACWGAVYLLIGFGACLLIRADYGSTAAILFLLMVWATDISAFFSGKIIGGRKLAPRISPNKTIAGFVGGLIAASLIGAVFFLMSMALGYMPWGVTPLLFVAVLGLIVGVIGQAGDLLESQMKRIAGVKDAGTLIPGHGGVLDRIDSMLMAAPVFYIIYNFFPFGI